MRIHIAAWLAAAAFVGSAAIASATDFGGLEIGMTAREARAARSAPSGTADCSSTI